MLCTATLVRDASFMKDVGALLRNMGPIDRNLDYLANSVVSLLSRDIGENVLKVPAQVA